jgi:hypothetical protein
MPMFKDMTPEDKKALKDFSMTSAYVAIVFFLLSLPAVYNATARISPSMLGQGKTSSIALHAVVAGLLVFGIASIQHFAMKKKQ